MRCYVLDDSRHTGKMWLVFGSDAVEAANGLIAAIGGPNDVNRFSVSGSFPVDPASPISLSQFWPHFTSHPGRHSKD